MYLRRCLYSDNVDGCCAMFNNCSSVLESTYREHFFSKLKLGYPSISDLTQAIRNRFQSPEQIQKQKVYFLVTLNNIDQSIEFISTVKKTFEVLIKDFLFLLLFFNILKEYTSKLFDQESKSSREKLTVINFNQFEFYK